MRKGKQGLWNERSVHDGWEKDIEIEKVGTKWTNKRIRYSVLIKKV